MMEQKNIIHVEYDNNVMKYHADNFRVTENGHLEIMSNHFIVACYAPGVWDWVMELKDNGEE
jgi:hypothetical protein